MIKATIVILTKNPGAIFRRVLASCVCQVTDFDYEIIVIDSGSKDGTLELCAQTPLVRLVEIEPSEYGHGKTRNLGAKLARGKYVAYLTHDATPADEYWLRNIVRPLEERPDVAGVFGRHLPYEDATPTTRQDLFNCFEQFKAGVYFRMEDPKFYAESVQYRQNLHFYSDNNSCLRRSVWEIIPYPDVDFSEDQMWAKAIIEAGYTKAYAHDSVVFHSHDYMPKELFRRSFDESMSFKKHFDYNLCPGLVSAFLTSFAMARRDYGLWRASYPKGSRLAIILTTLSYNLHRQFGYYLGQRYNRLSKSLVASISLDKSLKSGALKVNWRKM